jgi:hypothetical protein
MKYAIEMDSGAMIYIPSSIKTGSDIKKLIGSIHKHTGTQRHRHRHTDSMVIA